MARTLLKSMAGSCAGLEAAPMEQGLVGSMGGGVSGSGVPPVSSESGPAARGVAWGAAMLPTSHAADALAGEGR